MTRHFRTLLDLGREGLLEVLARSAELERLRGMEDHPRPLAGRSVIVLLEKASTRTRLSFEIGIHEMGGHPVTLLAGDSQLGRGEPIADTARTMSGYGHAVVYRTFGHDRVEALADASAIPVINGLSDTCHPCQLLADLRTVQQHVRAELEGVRVAWIGDGNNVAHSWMLAAGLTGLELTVASPAGHRPCQDVIDRARGLGRGTVRVVDDPDEAVRDAEVVTTDVWASMGQEQQAEGRQRALQDYYVDGARMERAAPGAIFLHCLPAHRGEEVSAEVIDGPDSRVGAQSDNRLHTQKALLEWLLQAR